jgi:hypothetical protein
MLPVPLKMRCGTSIPETPSILTHRKGERGSGQKGSFDRRNIPIADTGAAQTSWPELKTF